MSIFQPRHRRATQARRQRAADVLHHELPDGPADRRDGEPRCHAEADRLGRRLRQTRVWHYARSYASCRNQLDIDGVEYGGYDFPTPNAFYFADSVRAWQANKVRHVFIQNEMTIARDMPEMKSWLWAKLIEDPNRDADKLMNEFLAGYYGSAGKAVRQYLDYLKQRAAAAPSSTNWFSGLKCAYLDEAFYQTADQILRDTGAALEDNTDPIYRQRLNEVRCSALRGFLVQWPSIAQRWVAAGNDIAKYPIDRDRLYELYVKTQEARIARMSSSPLGWNRQRLQTALQNHLRNVSGRYLALPLPEQFMKLPCAGIFDLPVASGMFKTSGSAVTIEKDPSLDQAEVLVVKSPGLAFPLGFYTKGNSPIGELAKLPAEDSNAYRWYRIGVCTGTDGIQFFAGNPVSLIWEGDKSNREAWAQMKVETRLDAAGGKTIEAIRLARVILIDISPSVSEVRKQAAAAGQDLTADVTDGLLARWTADNLPAPTLTDVSGHGHDLPLSEELQKLQAKGAGLHLNGAVAWVASGILGIFPWRTSHSPAGSGRRRSNPILGRTSSISPAGRPNRTP